jgi:anti-sigma B factor antagonist
MSPVKQFIVSRSGPIAIVEINGRIDNRTSIEFERVATDLLGDDVRAVVVDFTKVDMMTSAGIRVLFKMRKHLDSTGRLLALCALHDRVRRVLDIAGLLPQFSITVSRQEALAALAGLDRGPTAAVAPASKLARLVALALSDDGPEPERRSGGTRSAAASLVVASLERNSS